MWQRSVKVIKYSGYNRSKTQDPVVMERQRSLVNKTTGETMVSLPCFPQHDREWALGYLYSELGIRTPPESVILNGPHIDWTPGPPTSVPIVKRDTPIQLAVSHLHQLTASFQEAAILYKSTGATQSAALATTNDIVAHAEDLTDIGAFYKVIGKSLLNDTLPQFSIGIISGKVDESTVRSWAKLGTSILISRGALTDLAIDCAIDNNLCLIGFARGVRFSIYTFPERIRQ